MILEASAKGEGNKESIEALLRIPPGLENVSPHQLNSLHPKAKDELRRGIVMEAMKNNLLPFEGKRVHRKSKTQTMSFVELGRVMCSQWKEVDSITESIFYHLAEQGKVLHRERLAQDKFGSVTHTVIDSSVSKNTRDRVSKRVQVKTEQTTSGSNLLVHPHSRSSEPIFLLSNVDLPTMIPCVSPSTSSGESSDEEVTLPFTELLDDEAISLDLVSSIEGTRGSALFGEHAFESVLQGLGDNIIWGDDSSFC